MPLTREQYDFLIEPIRPDRVQQLRGNSHLEQWDIRRHLIRAFGFGGFDVITKATQLLSQIEHPPASAGGKPRWSVVWAAEVRLVIKMGTDIAVYEDGATGDSQNQPSLGDAHDQALKTALSQALKRCAVNLGDQFGLSLYNGGKSAAVVLRSLVVPGGVTIVGAPEDTPVEPEPAATVEPEPEWDPVEQAAERDGWESEINGAKNLAELELIRVRLKTAREAGRLSPATVDHLQQTFAANKIELTEGPATDEPG